MGIQLNIGLTATKDDILSPTIDVFFAGKPAVFVSDIASAPTRGFWHYSRYPLIIIGIGTRLILIVSFGIVLAQYP